MKYRFTMAGHQAEYDLTAKTFTRWEADDETVAETRPADEQELEAVRRDLGMPTAHQEALAAQIAEMQGAVDQLILNDLLGL